MLTSGAQKHEAINAASIHPTAKDFAKSLMAFFWPREFDTFDLEGAYMNEACVEGSILFHMFSDITCHCFKNISAILGQTNGLFSVAHMDATEGKH